MIRFSHIFLHRTDFRSCEKVQKRKMILTVEQSLIIMLAVNVNQQGGGIPQSGHTDSFSVDPADTSALHKSPAQSNHIILGNYVQLL